MPNRKVAVSHPQTGQTATVLRRQADVMAASGWTEPNNVPDPDQHDELPPDRTAEDHSIHQEG